MNTRRTAMTLKAAACAVAMAITATSAPAADISWRLNNNFAAARPETRHLHDLADDIRARTGGAMDITVHDGGSLGLKDADILRWLPTGGAEIGVLSASFVGRDAPELSAVYIQGVIRNVEEHQRALAVLTDIQREALEARGLVTVGFLGQPVIPASIFCREPGVDTLDALRTKKLRVWSKDLVDTFKALDVSAQIIPQNELYVALKTGVVDCAIYPAQFARSISLQEVATYASFLFPTSSVPYVIVAAKDKWEALPADIQTAMTAATADLYARTITNEGADAAEAAVRTSLAQDGVTWQDDFPQADRDAFAAAASETWKHMSERAGAKATEWRKTVYDAINAK